MILLASFFLAKGDPFQAGLWVFLIIALSVATTLGVSLFLSRGLLQGVPSSFVLELPPYRKPKVLQVLLRSLLDRTIYVLGRAITVAIPAGAIIWLVQNISIGDSSILYHMTTFLDPLGGAMGLSGAILAAFILGIPANEIILPILLMFYSQSGMLVETTGMAQAGALLEANGWTWVTAVCAIVFSLNHFPCATTLMTIKKETGSWYWTAFSALLPTAVGILFCCVIHFLAVLIGV